MMTVKKWLVQFYCLLPSYCNISDYFFLWYAPQFLSVYIPDSMISVIAGLQVYWCVLSTIPWRYVLAPIRYDKPHRGTGKWDYCMKMVQSSVMRGTIKRGLVKQEVSASVCARTLLNKRNAGKIKTKRFKDKSDHTPSRYDRSITNIDP